ncbi:7358_t:CDS:2 [Funneliformis geosporum]|nr:7358_t:CDS:2 [Funneliformis geosporum]
MNIYLGCYDRTHLSGPDCLNKFEQNGSFTLKDIAQDDKLITPKISWKWLTNISFIASYQL